ncbi:ankyrin repeat domain-containing protein [Sphingomonas sp. MMS12-HWE2-04]|uniref:ankyrin repeat domain-containing protein n=1 Tax=Sphingomonas sp. MMS12-HWE2-04 TaxID=3234199 RepID=UPI00384CFAAE
MRLLLPLLALMASACHDARADCFAPDTQLPARRETLADPGLGASGRELAEALYDLDLAAAKALLARDPRLASLPIGAHHEMLTLALATCEPQALDLVLAAGADPDGRDKQGLPLRLALRATTPAPAARLLEAGASPNPRANPMGPLRTAITLNSLGAVRLLLDHRADPDAAEPSGNHALNTALDMEHFRIAELLLERGANPWAVDATGGNLGTAVTSKMLTKSPEEAEAQRRLAKRLRGLGWPTSPPSPERVLALVAAGNWPPR